MKWPWRHQRPCPSLEIEDAARQASRSLEDAQAFERRAIQMSRDLAETLRRNHFAEAVARAMRGD